MLFLKNNISHFLKSFIHEIMKTNFFAVDTINNIKMYFKSCNKGAVFHNLLHVMHDTI